MTTPLSPLRFEPIFKSMLWGGTRLRSHLGHSPSDEPTGEAWLLSDVDGSESRVATGPLQGQTLRELMARFGEDLLGDARPINGRFPLLLKLIDARHELSVQVHPNDEQARQKHPTAAGKTEAWYILNADPAASRIYAGFNTGVTAEIFRRAMAERSVPGTLHQFTPEPGDSIFLPAGTVHAIGAEILLFEVQQTSDITYRLYDWDRVDARTGKPRDLHIDDGLACANFECGPCPPVRLPPGHGDVLATSEYFGMLRYAINRPLSMVSTSKQCRLLFVAEGYGRLDGEPLRPGDTLLLPAAANVSELVPEGAMSVLLCVPGSAA